MNVLAIDTSSYVLGVAVMKDGWLVGEYITYLKKNHSVRLMPAIRALMEEVDLTPNRLDRIVVSEGPGSYTGVRIGVTTAKTMAWSLKIPVVGVSSLEVLAQNGRHFNGYISPFIDARRGQVYTGLYESKNGIVQQVKEDQIIIHREWLNQLKEMDKPVCMLSIDMNKHNDDIHAILGEKGIIATVTDCMPRPGELARVGMEKKVEGETHDFSPNYIRLAEAEAKWMESQQTSK
ncbi:MULTISPECIES: tRNA (adenosine(37)-N6)-threonylcarbamoyltransferase complex dimerization subunit type 1 TsaB [Bacillaceae]|uniref:tRNA (Adenosine(37)-N6)-threonylcarbamoyltransferase complex dimerization subunit type 1 TsaB n=1 Tax=Evansella alkalicola TaxID=745819 RepID=A0ABS6JYL6_9BACI|nr:MULTISPECIES: tRNA (adenosine(37)-N6)-threonylcarbamoyltransferase complex dimerization subunit type 1 TsaB [Bacillaceae]MBU9723679.1 tRNA (adenosine(37)-N6)-threonylcarbamoyltransferase complex dimerization subunit type 1 TsaB [Bacillus alkalicola]